MLLSGLRARATLGRVLEELGSTLIEVVVGELVPTSPVENVVIADPLDPPDLLNHSVILGIGVSDPAVMIRTLREGADADAVALIVRAPFDLDDDLRDAVRQTGLLVLGLTRGASWEQVATLLRSMLTVDDLWRGEGKTPAGINAGDLFALAGAVSSLIDAPVTIEDLNSRVLAFSANQDLADESRRETVLGQRVPDRYLQALDARGDFRKVYASERPVYLDGIAGDDLPRVAIRVRAGDQILGSMWAAIREPLSPDLEQTYVDAAKVVALEMLRQHAGADIERRVRSDLVATVLDGGLRSSDAAHRLGIAGGPSCVIAIGLRNQSEPSNAEVEVQRLGNAFALHLSAIHPRSAVAALGGVVYAILRLGKTHKDVDESEAANLLRGFLKRRGDRGPGIVAGVGRIAAETSELDRSRVDADRALRVVRLGRASGSVAIAREVQPQCLMLDLADMATVAQYEPSGPLHRLITYDAQHSTHLMETLRAWLDAFGDAAIAASRAHVHYNTFRYRLRRVAEVGEIDLEDTEARFAAMLEMRLFDHT